MIIHKISSNFKRNFTLMKTNIIKEILQSIITIHAQDWKQIAKLLTPQTLKAKTLVCREGQTMQYLYFVASGLLRTYVLENGKDVSTYFACDKQFISCYSSFILQKPSQENLEVIEDSFVYRISYKDLQMLYQKNPKLERIRSFLAEQNYLCILDRALTLQTKTAKERYIAFMEKHEFKTVQRLPQYMLASYLGIAPESLSRIRKELSIS